MRFKLPRQDATCHAGEFSIDVPSAAAFDDLDDRLTALEDQVPDCLAEEAGDAIFTGCDVEVRNGLGNTASMNGKGNLIVGTTNNITAAFASVTGGSNNTASGRSASVRGGSGNTASGDLSAVGGGSANLASGLRASVSGGQDNAASGTDSSMSGGQNNVADGDWSSVSAGLNHTISVDSPFADNDHDWIAGTLVEDF